MGRLASMESRPAKARSVQAKSLRSRQEVGDHIGLAGSLEAIAELAAVTSGLPAGILGW